MYNINEMLLKLEGFQYAKWLDLSMGYYHILFRENTSNLCIIILHWGKYSYKQLPKVIEN